MQEGSLLLDKVFGGSRKIHIIAKKGKTVVIGMACENLDPLRGASVSP